MKVVFYRDKCIGCGVCVELYPQRWQISRKDGKSNLIGSLSKRNVYVFAGSRVEEEEFRKSERDCPVKVIQVI